MYNYHDVFFYYAFGTLNGGGGSIQVIGIAEGTTSVTFESNGKPLITYRIYGSSSGVGDINAETGKYDITVTCDEDTYTISLDAPLMPGEYIDYKTQRLYPSGLDVSMPEISTVSGTNTLTVITTNPSSKVYVEYYRAKDVPIVSPNVVIGSVPFDFDCYEAWHLIDYSISGDAVQDGTPTPESPVPVVGCGTDTAGEWTLPLTVNGTEYPIYLGTVPTTRRVKKLVLTGEENITLYTYLGRHGVAVNNMLEKNYNRAKGICTHYPVFSGDMAANVLWIGVNNRVLYFIAILDTLGITTADEFKSFLAAQYANGTPVTVWYVLAEPETAVVNDPLMKIDNYADTINLSQSGIDIPVIEGDNVLTINTDVPPSETYIKYNGKEKEYGYYITSDGYVYTTSDGYKYGIRS